MIKIEITELEKLKIELEKQLQYHNVERNSASNNKIKELEDKINSINEKLILLYQKEVNILNES